MILASVASVLLTILKIIGIVLLCILGLVLLIILLVLFCPISYRLSAVHNEQETVAKAKIGFLIINGLVSFTKGEGLDYYVKALFFKVFPRNKGNAEDDGEDLLEEYLEEHDEDDITFDLSQESNDNETSDTSELPEPDFESNTQSIDTDNDQSEETSENEDLLEENLEENLEDISEDISEDKSEVDSKSEKIPLKQKLSEKYDKASDKVDELLDKADKRLDEADKKYNEIMKKTDHVLQFLDRDYVERTIIRALKIVKRLFGTIKPKKSKGYLHMGLKSSADTGMMLGKIAAFYPLYGRWLTIEPDFYNKVIEGDIDIKGRIYLFRVVGPVLRMALTRDFWRTYKLAKKI